MAALDERKYLGKTFSNAKEMVKVIYDFAVDGGATGALDIFEASSDVVITGFFSVVKTTATSGGSATLKVGVTGDDDAFMTTTQGAVASLTAGALILPPAVEGTPNTLPLPVKLASGAKILQTIGTAALTAGKVEYTVEYTRLQKRLGDVTKLAYYGRIISLVRFIF